MRAEKVLLVEDAQDMHMVVEGVLGQECELLQARTLNEAEAVLRSRDIALIVLDVSLPDGNGFDWCRRLREDPAYSDVPVIFLTGLDSVEQRVHGFEAGGDDYIVKPFEPREFNARIRAKLKRHIVGRSSKSTLRVSAFTVDLPAQKAFLRSEEGVSELQLTPIEFKLLVHFLRHPGRVFKREELLESVWGQTVYVSGHTVDTHISSLRRKVGIYGHLFRAVVKRGYCFSPLENEKPPLEKRIG